ncbi:ATP-dependent (S)-NAD(P)H-hydrate dehydratase [Pirellulimonas nuda]|uniref:ADP-dependent (S)-NAD(P)H-hydrate dehydratase n=1 Tax=Pirellulimonas nuda TaxID=2528009 RepID=A0A518D7N4_9BACT|nr:NAD(P)H-hydrate dehydratase [Pirellulimonas nuda]QDU87456.1 ATP-dependent (S)-NAD(P)H-hydrate dehydratase [Pirellulimonas nuda]
MSTQPDTTPLPRLPTRDADSHKGDYGRVLVIAGSRGMAGAAALAGMAALRSGAGLVTVATPRAAQRTVAGFCPALMTLGLMDNDGSFDGPAIDPLLDLAAKADVVALGPGLGRSVSLDLIVRRLVAEVDRPMVVDADALSALALDLPALADAPAPRVLTPHPGEFKRLAGAAPGPSDAERVAAARRFASEHGPRTTLLLKGARTVVTDGDRHAINSTGNPGMATAGCGDVLTGVLAALLAQGLAPYDAARLAAHLHGAAGDLAAERVGPVSLIATDLLESLPVAFRQQA